MLTYALIGAIVGLLVYFINFAVKEQRFNKIKNSIKEPGIEYSALYHYASEKRFRNSFKFFDSYGMLYLIGNTLYYKTTEGSAPLTFDLSQCTVQMEKDWRLLKWFSITTPGGEKYYFDSQKMGVFKNNSDETVNGFEKIRAKSKQ